MRGTGGLWASVPDMASREKQEALRLLEESQGLLGAILMGVALQYRSLDMERARLLGDGCGDPKEMQAAASLVTKGEADIICLIISPTSSARACI